MLNPVERETLWLMAANSMKVARVAKASFCSRKAVYARLSTIEIKTGIDPTDFWGLKALVEKFDIREGVG